MGLVWRGEHTLHVWLVWLPQFEGLLVNSRLLMLRYPLAFSLFVLVMSSSRVGSLFFPRLFSRLNLYTYYIINTYLCSITAFLH
jgi:hypothetical protein